MLASASACRGAVPAARAGRALRAVRDEHRGGDSRGGRRLPERPDGRDRELTAHLAGAQSARSARGDLVSIGSARTSAGRRDPELPRDRSNAHRRAPAIDGHVAHAGSQRRLRQRDVDLVLLEARLDGERRSVATASTAASTARSTAAQRRRDQPADEHHGAHMEPGHPRVVREATHASTLAPSPPPARVPREPACGCWARLWRRRLPRLPTLRNLPHPRGTRRRTETPTVWMTPHQAHLVRRQPAQGPGADEAHQEPELRFDPQRDGGPAPERSPPAPLWTSTPWPRSPCSPQRRRGPRWPRGPPLRGPPPRRPRHEVGRGAPVGPSVEVHRLDGEHEAHGVAGGERSGAGHRLDGEQGARGPRRRGRAGGERARSTASPEASTSEPPSSASTASTRATASPERRGDATELGHRLDGEHEDGREVHGVEGHRVAGGEHGEPGPPRRRSGPPLEGHRVAGGEDGPAPCDYEGHLSADRGDARRPLLKAPAEMMARMDAAVGVADAGGARKAARPRCSRASRASSSWPCVSLAARKRGRGFKRGECTRKDRDGEGSEPAGARRTPGERQGAMTGRQEVREVSQEREHLAVDSAAPVFSSLDARCSAACRVPRAGLPWGTAVTVRDEEDRSRRHGLRGRPFLHGPLSAAAGSSPGGHASGASEGAHARGRPASRTGPARRDGGGRPRHRWRTPTAVVLPCPRIARVLRCVDVWLSLTRHEDGQAADEQHAVFSRNTTGDLLRVYLPVLRGGLYDAKVGAVALVDFHGGGWCALRRRTREPRGGARTCRGASGGGGVRARAPVPLRVQLDDAGCGRARRTQGSGRAD